MSAHRILGVNSVPRGLAVRQLKSGTRLGSERRETVRSYLLLAQNIERSILSTRTGMDVPLVHQLFCQGHSFSTDEINAEGI